MRVIYIHGGFHRAVHGGFHGRAEWVSKYGLARKTDERVEQEEETRLAHSVGRRRMARLEQFSQKSGTEEGGAIYQQQKAEREETRAVARQGRAQSRKSIIMSQAIDRAARDQAA